MGKIEKEEAGKKENSKKEQGMGRGSDPNQADKRNRREKTNKTERTVRAVVLILLILILCVAGYGAAKSGKLKLPKLGKTDPLGIEHIVIGSCEADVTEEEGVWYIDLAVDEDFSFQRAAINLELPEGAYVSTDTNCLITELGGQYLVNLGVPEAALTITDGEESRDYLFRIELN